MCRVLPVLSSPFSLKKKGSLRIKDDPQSLCVPRLKVRLVLERGLELFIHGQSDPEQSLSEL